MSLMSSISQVYGFLDLWSQQQQEQLHESIVNRLTYGCKPVINQDFKNVNLNKIWFIKIFLLTNEFCGKGRQRGLGGWVGLGGLCLEDQNVPKTSTRTLPFTRPCCCAAGIFKVTHLSLMTAVAFLTTSCLSDVEVVDSQTSDLISSAKVMLRPSRDITKPSGVTLKGKSGKRYVLLVPRKKQCLVHSRQKYIISVI